MGPSKRPRSAIKRHSYIEEAASNKYGEKATKSGQRKRKLSDMLGPQWSKKDLEHFYEAYRKYGKDWKKVASAVHNRSMEMVEALYTMNKAYLSLPEGIASVVGLIAMMTDHYSLMGGSDSEKEFVEASGISRKRQKHARSQSRSETAKGLEGHTSDVSQSNAMRSTKDFLSLLNNGRSGIRPHAVKKRTPRVPVAYSNDKDNSRRYYSPARQGLTLTADAKDNDVAQEIALSLTEASHRGGSPLVSQTPKRKAKATTPSSVRNGERMCAESEKTIARLHDSEMDEGELSLGGSTETDNEDYGRDEKYAIGRKGTGALEYQQRGKRYIVKKQEVRESKNNHFEDIKEACSGTEEGQKLGTIKGKLETKVANGARSFYKDPRKKTEKSLVAGDEDSPFDALQTLADLSLMMPDDAHRGSESSVHVKEDNFEIANKSKLKWSRSVTGVEDAALKTSELGKLKEGVNQSNNGLLKRIQKSLLKSQVYNEAQTDCHRNDDQKIEATVESKKSVSKGKRYSDTTHPKQGKLVKTLWNASSTTDRKMEENNSSSSTVEVPFANQVNLPTKDQSKLKIDLEKSSIQKDRKPPEIILLDQPDKVVPLFLKTEPYIKEKLSKCLSRYQVRRWCTFEWFYSAIDYPWFAKREFLEYLDHVGLGHVPRLTRAEWGVIKSSLGKPRRFSEKFLKEEKEKLNQYRESVRTHYAEVIAGTRKGLPTDLAQPLSAGQHVIAFHPRAREIHNGIVLAADHSRYYVQFDQPELGVEFIMDIDCMPLNPVESLPDSFKKHNVIVNKFIDKRKELKTIEQLKEGTSEGYTKLAPSDKLESTGVPCYNLPWNHTYKSSKQTAGNSSFNVQAKSGPAEIASTQVANSGPSVPAYIQAKEADVQALYDLTRVLDKKEAVISELRSMNDEVLENQRDGDNSIRDSEPFKKEYAAVLLQLSEVNDQVSSALFRLRQRNTYRGSCPYTVVNPMTILSDPGSHSGSYGFSCHAQESAAPVSEIVESSRAKARKMVDAAMKAVSFLRKEDKIDKTEVVIDFVSNRLSDEVSMLAMGSPSTPADPVLVSQDQSSACSSKPLATGLVPDDPEPNNLYNQHEEKILSDLIVNCVAAFLMIQACTARQFPPADVAQVLDHAITSLKPFCSQNLSVYGEIQKCMGVIRNQIVALVPT